MNVYGRSCEWFFTSVLQVYKSTGAEWHSPEPRQTQPGQGTVVGPLFLMETDNLHLKRVFYHLSVFFHHAVLVLLVHVLYFCPIYLD